MSQETEMQPPEKRSLLEQQPRLPEVDTIGMFQDDRWFMSFGERAALEGVLSQLRPKLALEIGAGGGGSLRRIAAYSDEVHEVDIKDRPPPLAELKNVHWHTGDSHVVLPELLSRLTEQGRNIDFAHIDGDHSAEGARRDMQDLLDSPATGRTIILAHDTMNEMVRSGLEQVDYEGISKVAYVELDFVPGYLFRSAGWRHQLWGGLGLVIVEADSAGATLRQDRYYEAQPLMSEIKRIVMEREGPDEPITPREPHPPTP